MLRELSAAQWTWILYDMGSYGFATATITTVMPIFFKEGTGGGFSPHDATVLWGYALSAASLTGAVAAPVLGALADGQSCRRLVLGLCIPSACLSAILFSFVAQTGHAAAVLLVAATCVAHQLSACLYNSFLPCLFSRDQAHAVSPLSTAFSQLGAGLMSGAVYMLHHSRHAQLAESTVRWIIALAALCWLAFAAFFVRHVAEPQISLVMSNEAIPSHTQNPFRRVLSTWSELYRHKDLARFIAAGFCIAEGLGLIFHMSLLYAVAVCHIDYSTVLLATLASRFSGALFSMGWHRIVQTELFGADTPRTCLWIAIVLAILACALCGTLQEAWQYWFLSVLLSCAGTGATAFSRSLLSSLCSPEKASELFGYSAMMGHAAGFMGPLLFAGAVQLTSAPHSGFAVTMGFLLLGAGLFYGTDFETGQALANGTPCANLADVKAMDDETHRLLYPAASSPTDPQHPQSRIQSPTQPQYSQSSDLTRHDCPLFMYEHTENADADAGVSTPVYI